MDQLITMQYISPTDIISKTTPNNNSNTTCKLCNRSHDTSKCKQRCTHPSCKSATLHLRKNCKNKNDDTNNDKDTNDSTSSPTCAVCKHQHQTHTCRKKCRLEVCKDLPVHKYQDCMNKKTASTNTAAITQEPATSLPVISESPSLAYRNDTQQIECTYTNAISSMEFASRDQIQFGGNISNIKSESNTSSSGSFGHTRTMHVATIPVDVYVDSCADTNHMSSKFWHNLQQQLPKKYYVIEKCNHRYRSHNNQVTTVTKAVTLPLLFEDQLHDVKFLVSDAMDMLILGRPDAHRLYDFTLFSHKEQMELFKKSTQEIQIHKFTKQQDTYLDITPDPLDIAQSNLDIPTGSFEEAFERLHHELKYLQRAARTDGSINIITDDEINNTMTLFKQSCYDPNNDTPIYVKDYIAKITLKSDAKPCWVHYEIKDPIKKRVITNVIKQNLKKQRFEITQDKNWNHMFVVVDKPGKKMSELQCWILCPETVHRVTSNLINLNAQVEKQPPLLPKERAQNLDLRGHKYYCRFDQKDAYWSIKLDPKSRKYTAFTAPDGTRYQYTVLPQGFINGSAIQQEIMTKAIIGIEHAYVFQDDVAGGSHTARAHFDLITSLVTRFHHYQLQLNPDKCYFVEFVLHYLGRDISSNGSSMSTSRLQAYLNLRIPQSKEELNSYLCSLQYWHNYLPKLAILIAPFTQLIKKGSKFQWNSNHQDAWTDIQQQLKENLVCAPLDPQKDVILQTDASDYGVGAVLLQYYHTHFKPIAFISSKFTDSQLKYSIGDKEASAIVWAVTKLADILNACTATLIVETDHESLISIFKTPVTGDTVRDRRILRYQMIMSNHNWTIRYIKGSMNPVADVLSRMSSLHDTSCCTLLTLTPLDKQQSTQELTKIHIQHFHGPNHEVLESFKASYTYNGNLENLIVAIKKACHTCQSHANFNHTNKAIRNSNDESEATGPMQKLCMDVVHLPITKSGNKFVLLAVDVFSRKPYTYMYKTDTVAATVITFLQFIFSNGLYQNVQMDKAPYFENKEIEKFFKSHGATTYFTTVNRHQQNLAERFIRSLLEALRKRCMDTNCEWDNFVYQWTLLKSCSINKQTGYAPMYLHTGRNPPDITSLVFSANTFVPSSDINAQVPPAAIDDDLDPNAIHHQHQQNTQLEEAIADTISRNKKTKHNNASVQNRDTPSTPHVFTTGDIVYFQEHRENILKLDKLATKWHGPGTVTRCLRNNVYISFDDKVHIRDANDVKLAVAPLDPQAYSSQLLKFGPTLRSKSYLKHILLPSNIPDPQEYATVVNRLSTAKGKRWLSNICKAIEAFQLYMDQNNITQAWYKYISPSTITTYTDELQNKRKQHLFNQLNMAFNFMYNLDSRNQQLAKFH